MLEKVEYSVFFPVVRIVAFISASVLFIAVIVSLIFYTSAGAVTSSVLQGVGKRIVSYTELRASIHPEETQVTIPRNIERRLNENTSQVLQNWLNGFRTTQEKDDFLKNLSQVIAEAERNDPGNIDKYINNFRNLYMDNMSQKSRMNREALGIPEIVEKAIDQYVSPLVTRLARGVIVLGIVLLFTLFVITVSLLSLLSIERNTR